MANRVESVYKGILKCSNKKMNEKYKTIHQLLYYYIIHICGVKK